MAAVATAAVIGAVVSAGLSIADSVVGYIDAKERAEFLEDQFEIRKAAAIEAYVQQAGQVRSRSQQERSQVAEEIRDIVRTSLNRRGSIASAAGSANVAGTSISDALLDNQAQEAKGRGRLRLLQEFREAQAEATLRALRSQARNRITGAFPDPNLGFNVNAEIIDAFSAAAQGAVTGASLA